jgi:hypothetical protein
VKRAAICEGIARLEEDEVLRDAYLIYSNEDVFQICVTKECVRLDYGSQIPCDSVEVALARTKRTSFTDKSTRPFVLRRKYHYPYNVPHICAAVNVTPARGVFSYGCERESLNKQLDVMVQFLGYQDPPRHICHQQTSYSEVL